MATENIATVIGGGVIGASWAALFTGGFSGHAWIFPRAKAHKPEATLKSCTAIFQSLLIWISISPDDNFIGPIEAHRRRETRSTADHWNRLSVPSGRSSRQACMRQSALRLITDSTGYSLVIYRAACIA